MMKAHSPAEKKVQGVGWQ